MGATDRKYFEYFQDVAMWMAMGGFVIYSMYNVLQRLDPDAGAKADAKKKAQAATSRLQSIFGKTDRGEDGEAAEDLKLTSYEQTIAMEVVSPNEIPITFDDIGGLDDIVEELRESIIYPLTMPHLYAQHSSLLTAPSGVLLYGPPGCGKSMLAKAVARESGASFINVHISTLTEKWYGDSNKLVSAVFSLARKLQPAIVFIDEIDAVLGQRRSGEHEASGMVKAEFMTHWDGLISSTTDGGDQRICILGATNRAQDIDEAILRRMPKRFAVSLPNKHQRRQIFELTLKDTKIDWSVDSEGRRAFDMDTLLRLSAGMSGSDIKEACRDAAMMPVRSFFKEQKQYGRSLRNIDSDAVRGVQTQDFFATMGGAGQMQQKTTRHQDSSRRKTVEDLDDVSNDGTGSTEEVDDFDDHQAEEKSTHKRR